MSESNDNNTQRLEGRLERMEETLRKDIARVETRISALSNKAAK